MRKIVIIAHDIRSCHNVGSLLRTAECMGVERIYFTGYTPYPQAEPDERLPHIARKLTTQIHKTALGAEALVPWQHIAGIEQALTMVKTEGYTVVALEQTSQSIGLPAYQPPERVALLLGREVEGIDPALIELCDTTVVIPQFGQKESLNVIEAASMALYHLRFAK